jgi:hypothetical protein
MKLKQCPHDLSYAWALAGAHFSIHNFIIVYCKDMMLGEILLRVVTCVWQHLDL